MARSTEGLYDPKIIVTDQLDFYGLYAFDTNIQQIFQTEIIAGTDLYSHVAQAIRHQKIGICIKDDVYRTLIASMLEMDRVQWLSSQVRLNRVRLNETNEIIMIGLQPGMMHPQDLQSCEYYNACNALQFVSFTSSTPAYQRVLA